MTGDVEEDPDRRPDGAGHRLLAGHRPVDRGRTRLARLPRDALCVRRTRPRTCRGRTARTAGSGGGNQLRYDLGRSARQAAGSGARPVRSRGRPRAGSIVTIGSIGGRIAVPHLLPYSTEPSGGSSTPSNTGAANSSSPRWRKPVCWHTAWRPRPPAAPSPWQPGCFRPVATPRSNAEPVPKPPGATGGTGRSTASPHSVTGLPTATTSPPRSDVEPLTPRSPRRNDESSHLAGLPQRRGPQRSRAADRGADRRPRRGHRHRPVRLRPPPLRGTRRFPGRTSSAGDAGGTVEEAAARHA